MNALTRTGLSLFPNALGVRMRNLCCLSVLSAWALFIFNSFSPVCAAQEPQHGRGQDVQAMELIPRRLGGWVFPLTTPPQLVWRDAATALELGLPNPPTVRWFDQRSLREAEKPLRKIEKRI